MRRLTGTVVAAATVLALAGCGSGGLAARGDANSGQKLFVAKCAGCHSLAAAGSTATVGPNLDGAFGSDRRQGFDETSIRAVVMTQMRYPNPPMPDDHTLFPLCGRKKPAGCVDDRGQALEDVAAYVAKYAGSQGPEPPTAAAAGTGGKSIFASNCASCHTLKAANAQGQVGPNLDQLKPALAVVKNQVIHGGGVMPAFKGKLTDEQIDAVSKFVADNAGK